jgi:hypothetical protein
VLAWGTAIRDSVRRYHVTETGSEARGLEVIGLALFGALINLFLGGGALNISFMALVVGLLVGLENNPRQKKHLPTAPPASE